MTMDMDDLLKKLRQQVEQDRKKEALERAAEEKAEAEMKSARMKDLTKLKDRFFKSPPTDEDEGYAAIEDIHELVKKALDAKRGEEEKAEKAAELLSRMATVSSASRRVTPGGTGPAFAPMSVGAMPMVKLREESRVRHVPDPVAVFLARLSPETQEIIRLDLIARLAGIMSGLSEHKETEERIADLEAFDKLADKIAETPDWASF